MKKAKSQQGIIHPTMIFSIALIVAVVAFAGWRTYQHRNSASKSTSTLPSSTIDQTLPSTVSTKVNVQKAIGVTNSSAIDSDLDTSSFNSDISSLQ